MRAAFFEGLQAITVRRTAVPEPGPGEVRLRVRYCGICGSDLSLYKTGVLSGPDVVLGHEVSGVVDLDPAGEWPEGSRVAPFPGGRGCGTCVWCKQGKHRYCSDAPRTYGGGFAEYSTVPAQTLLRVPDDLDDSVAALAEPLGVAVRAVELARPEGGDLAYVSGLGSLGLLSVVALVAAGCRVIGAEPREERRSLALELGCETVIDPSADPIGTTLRTDPRGPRIAFECAGVPDSLQQAFDVCGFEGVIGILGIPMAPVFLLRMTLKEQRAFSIQGPSMDSMRRAMGLLRARPEIAKIITATAPLEGIDGALASMVAGQGGIKVLIEPGP
jgi:(R,R)-butanediol dehydrogenase / meso-butanediol dehydrogenase / diacetyl reductase